MISYSRRANGDVEVRVDGQHAGWIIKGTALTEWRLTLAGGLAERLGRQRFTTLAAAKQYIEANIQP